MKKLIILFSLLLTIAVASAVTVTTDKAIYESGETISVTVSGCTDGTSATAHIGTLWADQGTIAGGSWITQYQIPTAFPSTGSSQNLDAYCDGTASTNFCVNPGCSTGESEESEESSEESSGSTGGGGGGGGAFLETSSAPSNESVEAPSAAPSSGGERASTVYEQPAEDTTIQEPEEQQSESKGILGISLIAILVALLIGGGYFLMRRSKK